ncbi:unnamed protein product [Rotaria sp. Silwood2]|nr:unnamed protein product [Rotaria sp. Silwood2]
MSLLSGATLILALLICFHHWTCLSNRLPSGFVYVHDIIPDIQISLRYASEENFMGHVVNGYLSNVSIMTKAAAVALKQAQSLAKENSYELVIYDGYRPQKSVNQFFNWSQNLNDSQIKKSFYYPRINKEDTFELGYIAEKSGHTRGSTIDLTLILLGKHVQSPLKAIERNLTDNSKILYLDDGTIDMGSSFDLFDEASHTNSTLVNKAYQERRIMFKNLMEQVGFINYDREWWHYRLINEPFPDTYFDFDIESSLDRFNYDKLRSSSFGESFPSIKTNNVETTAILSNLSRCPESIDITNLTDEDLDKANLRTVSMSYSEEQNVNEDNHSLSYINKEVDKLEKTKELSRWDDALEKYEQNQEKNEIPLKDEKLNENVDNISVLPISVPSTEIVHVNVQEFKPTSINDPIFPVLRNLFVRSFDEYYKQIEVQLNLKSEKTLTQWLDETFNDERETILSGEYRCFILCSNQCQDLKDNILGFLTLKEEKKGSIYIAQVAVRLDIKRRGYGVQLLQHLRNIYPPNTYYWGLCRRANRPALQFYLKNGAKFMTDDDVATKYGYDPTLYAGFEFLDTISVIIPQLKTMVRTESDVKNSDQQPTIITTTQKNENPSLESDTEENQEQKNKTKLVECCIIL